MEYSEISPPPRQLVLETVSVCNLRCPSCRTGAGQVTRAKTTKVPFMPMDLVDKVCREARDSVRYTYVHNWGEPTLHKEIGQIIRKVKEFSAVQFTTHGMFVTEELAQDISLCDDIAVSIDGLDQATYEKYRVRGDLEKAMNGLRLLAKLAPKKVIWTFIVFSHNEHQLLAAQKMADALGIRIGFKPPYLNDESAQREMLPKNKNYLRYSFDAEGTPVLRADKLGCREFWETVYVNPNGDVVTCCYDYNASMIMGNINENTLAEVWNGEKYRTARKRHLAGDLNQMCKDLCKLPSIE